MIRPYSVTCVQAVIRQVSDPTLKDALIRENIFRQIALLDGVKAGSEDLKLAVMPAFSIQGADMSLSRDECLPLAIKLPGPESDLYAAAAREHQMYIAGCGWEYDEDWPDTFFLTGFLLSPEGEIVLKKRKAYSTLEASSPLDFYTNYKRHHGEESVFPVVDTPIGKLGMTIAVELCYPENQRCLALNGAEVIIHCAGEPWMENTEVLQDLKTATAYENQCYVVSANHGEYLTAIDGKAQFLDKGFPLFQERQQAGIAARFPSPGKSQVIDPHGQVLAIADAPGEATITAAIDIERLRYEREQYSVLEDLCAAAYAQEYERLNGNPIDVPLKGSADRALLKRDTMHRFYEQGLLVPPAIYPGNEPRAAGQP